MKKFYLIVSTIIFNTYAVDKVIYGQDDRVNYSEASPFWQQRGAATAAMIKRSKLKKVNQVYSNNRVLTLGERFGLCQNEAFYSEPVLSDCSGFLVAPDVIATAGHCLLQLPHPYWGRPEGVCQDYIWAFDYTMKNVANKEVKLRKTYNCKKIIKAEFQGDIDYALIKLDRPVRGIKPLKLAFNHTKGQELTLIGHPSGLPKKVSRGGKVLNSVHGSRKFLATVDSFQGNSGSAVLNKSGKVVGILVSGKTDYTYDLLNQCQRVNVCDNDARNCQDRRDFAKAEGVTKIKIIKGKF